MNELIIVYPMQEQSFCPQGGSTGLTNIMRAWHMMHGHCYVAKKPAEAHAESGCGPDRYITCVPESSKEALQQECAAQPLSAVCHAGLVIFNNSMYVALGNGGYDPANSQYGDSVLRLSLPDLAVRYSISELCRYLCQQKLFLM